MAVFHCIRYFINTQLKEFFYTKDKEMKDYLALSMKRDFKSSMRFREHLPLQNVSKNKSTIIFKDGNSLTLRKEKYIW